MSTNIKAYVGLDVHKDSIAIAYAHADSREPPRFLGTTPYSVISLTKALAKIGKPAELNVCHEAGPCGYGLVRALRERGYATEVIAPSRVPKKPGDRIKTDRRDALLLARLHRSAELTPIVVPEPKNEAIRDLVRTREDALRDRQRARLRLRSFDGSRTPKTSWDISVWYRASTPAGQSNTAVKLPGPEIRMFAAF